MKCIVKKYLFTKSTNNKYYFLIHTINKFYKLLGISQFAILFFIYKIYHYSSKKLRLKKIFYVGYFPISAFTNEND